MSFRADGFGAKPYVSKSARQIADDTYRSYRAGSTHRTYRTFSSYDSTLFLPKAGYAFALAMTDVTTKAQNDWKCEINLPTEVA